MQKSLKEDLALRGYDLVFEYKGSTIAVNTKEFTEEKEEAVYQKYGLKTMKWGEQITLYNPEVWKITDSCILTLIEDCLAPEQVFFTEVPYLQLDGIKDLRHWDVASAKSLSGMFSYCESLKELILDGWDVSSVKNMSFMLDGCESLEKLSLDGWNVSLVKDMRWLFSDCSSLRSLPLDGWAISEDANTFGLFFGCHTGISVESLKSSTTPCSVF